MKSTVILTNCERTDEDYKVTLLRPDGLIIVVLIPGEWSESYPNQYVTATQEPFGLNCVCEGHYT